MEIIARVFDIEITDADLHHESKDCSTGLEAPATDLMHVLNRLIDRCLLFHEAQEQGVLIDEDEFDTALLERLSDLDSEGRDYPGSVEEAALLEKTIRRQLLIRKHIRQMCLDSRKIDDNELLSFYQDQKDVFLSPELVRASHILIRRSTPDAHQKALDIRASIHNSKDFDVAIRDNSQCPSNQKCGDLGYFPRGRMIKEIENVAFKVPVGEISDVFSSPYGYHILLVTDKTEPAPVPFDEIKESLRTRLVQLEREFYLVRHLQQLREQYKDFIVILDDNLRMT